MCVLRTLTRTRKRIKRKDIIILFDFFHFINDDVSVTHYKRCVLNIIGTDYLSFCSPATTINILQYIFITLMYLSLNDFSFICHFFYVFTL